MSMIDTPNDQRTQPYVQAWGIEYVPDQDSSPTDYDCYDVDQIEAFNEGQWEYVGIRAWATVVLPRGGAGILQRITSPGLWSVESNSSPDYLAEIEGEEASQLIDMLADLNVDSDGWEAVRQS